jgi:hypothetical protein
MRQGGAIVFGFITALVRPAFWRKVAENRQAVRAGMPKPHSVVGLVLDAASAGAGAALPAVRRDKVREGIERGLEMLEAADTDETPREKPPTHRGLK